MEKFCFSISLNGVDNVGKTTQINRLKIETSVLAFDPPQFYDSEYKRLSQTPGWWFSKSTHEELIWAIFNALKRRDEVVFEAIGKKEDPCIVVFDRGTLMFYAACISTIAVKENCNVSRAKEIFGIG